MCRSVLQRVRAVDFRFARAQQVEVWAVEDEDCLRCHTAPLPCLLPGGKGADGKPASFQYAEDMEQVLQCPGPIIRRL